MFVNAHNNSKKKDLCQTYAYKINQEKRKETSSQSCFSFSQKEGKHYRVEVKILGKYEFELAIALSSKKGFKNYQIIGNVASPWKLIT